MKNLRKLLPSVWYYPGPLLIVAAYLIGFYHHPKPPVPQFSTTAEQSQLDYINDIRKDHKLPALKDSKNLDKAASDKVKDMVARHYWTHNTPDGTAWYILPERVAPGLRYYGENIGQCFGSNPALFDAYVASPEHLKNILNPHYSQFGGATLYDATKHCFVNANEFGG